MESNKEILKRIDSKLDKVEKEVAAMNLDFALKLSDFQNKNDKRLTKFESYLKSDPDTNQIGAIEKLDKVEKRVSTLETKAVIFGTIGGAIIIFIKWIGSLLFKTS